MSHDVLARRLVLILTKLNNGERLTLEELAIEFGTSTRTIFGIIPEL
jgi:predicted DNA-binding transcriptional regulator YafY